MLPTPRSFFLYCIKAQEAQQRRAGSKRSLVLSSRGAGTVVSMDKAGMGEGNKMDFFFFLNSLNDLSSSQAASPWAERPATMQLCGIIQPGNADLLLREVVGNRNHVELVTEEV